MVEGLTPMVYRWDLDKTYLRTEFDTVRDLLRTAFERPSRKQTVPGAAALLRAISDEGPAGVYILSGSPRQMRPMLERKLRLDGIRWDGFELKPSLRNLMRGRVRFLKEQVGYKLPVLLRGRSSGVSASEVLFGDDAEADALIYSLYADLCAGRVGPDELEQLLVEARVYEDDIPAILELSEQVPKGEAVERVFIHLDRVSDPDAFADFGPRLCPFYNYLQPAMVLVEDGHLRASSALRVAVAIATDQEFTSTSLIASFRNLADRGYVGPRAARQLSDAIESSGIGLRSNVLRTLREFGDALGLAAETLEEPQKPTHAPLDYLEVLHRERERAHAAKRRARSARR